MKTVLITGSGGLIGSQAVEFFISKKYHVIGIDNDMRSYFFGKEASTGKNISSMIKDYENFENLDIDIRSYEKLETVFQEHRFEIIIHTAAQPSHDWAAKEPLTDFSVNAIGTINLLELTRLHSPKATFIFTSTNKVYGDTPNYLDLVETDTRWELNKETFKYNYCLGSDASINENMSIDQTKHSIFGASKVAADVMVQEYGRYFGMNTAVFRGGCLTGPNHQGAELHGFLSYLIKCMVNDLPYVIFGYKGKQVRDNIHSWDLVNMFWHYHQNPMPGEVYNAGGGRSNNISILEAIDLVNKLRTHDGLAKWDNYIISDKARNGDHIWYISDIEKFKQHYPSWPGITITLEETIKQIYEFEKLKK